MTNQLSKERSVYWNANAEVVPWDDAMCGLFVIDGEEDRLFETPDDFFDWFFARDVLFPPERLPTTFQAESAGPLLIAREVIDHANADIDEDLPAVAMLRPTEVALDELQGMLDGWFERNEPQHKWFRPGRQVSLNGALREWQKAHPDDKLVSECDLSINDKRKALGKSVITREFIESLGLKSLSDDTIDAMVLVYNLATFQRDD